MGGDVILDITKLSVLVSESEPVMSGEGRGELVYTEKVENSIVLAEEFLHGIDVSRRNLQRKRGVLVPFSLINPVYLREKEGRCNISK